VIPTLQLAIEMNGNYWHSESVNPDKKYHLNKTELCENNGYKLLQIFEDEITYKSTIVKARLKHLLGITKYRIFGRKCTIRQIDTEVKNKFLNKYHIQGEDKSSVKLGAYYRNHLVAVMTFCKLRKALGQIHEEGSFELSRFATVSNFTVIGIAGKLLKHFENNFEITKIITYADRRWSTGNLYKKLGFELDHVSMPNYWYIKNYHEERIHRFNFRKDVLWGKLKNFDESKSEWENMKNNGYDRIWDCGNLVFVKNY
jgi:hypothetical protein